jgi:hypothetical protein
MEAKLVIDTDQCVSRCWRRCDPRQAGELLAIMAMTSATRIGDVEIEEGSTVQAAVACEGGTGHWPKPNVCQASVEVNLINADGEVKFEGIIERPPQ